MPVFSTQDLTAENVSALPRLWKEAARHVRDSAALLSQDRFAAGVRALDDGGREGESLYSVQCAQLAARARDALTEAAVGQRSALLDILLMELGCQPEMLSPEAARSASLGIRRHARRNDFISARYLSLVFSTSPRQSLQAIEAISCSTEPDAYLARRHLPELRALRKAIETETDSWEVAAWRTGYLQQDLPGIEMHPLVALDLWDDLLSRAETSYLREVAAGEIVRTLVACGDEVTARQWRDASNMLDLAYRAEATRLVRHRIRSRYMK